MFRRYFSLTLFPSWFRSPNQVDRIYRGGEEALLYASCFIPNLGQSRSRLEHRQRVEFYMFGSQQVELYFSVLGFSIYLVIWSFFGLMVFDILVYWIWASDPAFLLHTSTHYLSLSLSHTHTHTHTLRP